MIFGNFWRHLETSGIWELEIGISGNPHKLASFGQFQCMGYFSHSVEVTDLDFELRISNFQFFWNFAQFFFENWKFSGIAIFCQFQHIGHFSHSVKVTELGFELRISKFQFFWNFAQIFF